MFWRLVITFTTFALVAGWAVATIRDRAVDPAWAPLVPVLVALGCGIPAVVMARRFVRPLQELTDATLRIAEGEYGHHLPGTGFGESRSLAKTFSTMAHRLEAQFQQLEADRQQLRTILGGMIEGVIAITSQQRVLFANEAAGQMLDFDPEAAVGRPFWEISRLPQLQQYIARTLAEGAPVREELDWMGQKARQLAIYLAPLPGQPAAGAVVVLHNTTELRRLERVRQEFVANVSHELKTPLSVIKANIEALIDGAVEEPEIRRPFLDQIAEQGERLHALILDLISLARIESGEAVLDLQSVPVELAVTDCLDRHHSRAEAKDQRLRMEPSDAQAAQACVWADEEAFGQILDNLIDNAVKYTQPGGDIAVRWQLHGSSVQMQIEDNGPGIPERDLPRVFERFYRVDKARSREVGGTGLGLAIVKHLMQGMKGSVKATSQIGKGTIFTLTFPRAGGNIRT
jgi:two-component system phosphate regulon sensor histidine kinase PhoR